MSLWSTIVLAARKKSKLKLWVFENDRSGQVGQSKLFSSGQCFQFHCELGDSCKLLQHVQCWWQDAYKLLTSHVTFDFHTLMTSQTHTSRFEVFGDKHGVWSSDPDTLVPSHTVTVLECSFVGVGPSKPAKLPAETFGSKKDWLGCSSV